MLGLASPKISLAVYARLQSPQTADAIALLDARKAVAIEAADGGEADALDLAS